MKWQDGGGRADAFTSTRGHVQSNCQKLHVDLRSSKYSWASVHKLGTAPIGTTFVPRQQETKETDGLPYATSVWHPVRPHHSKRIHPVCFPLHEVLLDLSGTPCVMGKTHRVEERVVEVELTPTDAISPLKSDSKTRFIHPTYPRTHNPTSGRSRRESSRPTHFPRR